MGNVKETASGVPPRMLIGWVHRWDSICPVYLQLKNICDLVTDNDRIIPVPRTDQWILPVTTETIGIRDFLGVALDNPDPTPGMAKVLKLIEVCRHLGRVERELNCVKVFADGLSLEEQAKLRRWSSGCQTMLFEAWCELSKARDALAKEKDVVILKGLDTMLLAREKEHTLLKTAHAGLMPEFEEYWAIKTLRLEVENGKRT